MRREPARRARRSLTAPGPQPAQRASVVLDVDSRVLDGGRALLGGDPPRLVRLRVGGGDVLRRLHCAEPDARALARALVDRGLAHPRPVPGAADDVTVVVPVRDRADALDRCLAAVGGAVPVVVVDDGSRDAAAIAEIAARHGAHLVRLTANAGPASARNAGVAVTTTRLVGFVDSDCVPPPGWLPALTGHFADERVAAVAPRVRSRTGATLLARYARARGPLDLGPREAAVRPGGRVGYVATAVLVVRRDAVGSGFDAALRYGEDVDLVWRLHDDGWHVRYDPRVVVEHAEPATWSAWLRRRHRYGTSAAPLSRRHGERLSPLVLPPWLAAAVVLLMLRRPGAAAAAAAVPAGKLHRQLRAAGVPAAASVLTAARLTGRGLRATAAGLGGAGAVVTTPALLAVLASRGLSTRARTAAAAGLLVPPVLDWLARRPAIDPATWSVLRLLDDLAYASGVWRGCWTARTTAPLRPRRAPAR